MKVKNIWNNDDFEEMSWHDSSIYSIRLPQNTPELELDIDYIFKWILNDDTGLFKFYVSPCSLKFKDVFNLNIKLDFGNTIGVDIDSIKRNNPHLSPNNEITLWSFIIETKLGEISFVSSGFEQIVKEQPICSESYSLGRRLSTIIK